MTGETRRYEKKRRAEAEAETRRRITESAVELHSTLGPARTSVSAIAERAGVRRSTVYRHFPDEVALFDACSSHWEAANPPPDLDGWAAIEDPAERLRIALGELYAFYRRTERMMENLHRDEVTMPLVRERFAGFHAFIDAAHDLLVRGRPERGRRRDEVRAAIGHALAFTTWRSLTHDQGLDDDQAVELMCDLAGERVASRR
ncbi:MAG TPA: helix-turn-helix domain-containing protein [Thermoleophilaceae bacterium]|nr:helix-turn-helix domain-containing protein [Thermoleophilaceae bacterium]